jgi:hypothetical protein
LFVPSVLFVSFVFGFSGIWSFVFPRVDSNRFSVLSGLDSHLGFVSDSSSDIVSVSGYHSVLVAHTDHTISKGSLSGDLGSEEPIVLASIIEGHIQTSCMIDCGATSQFIDFSFCRSQGLKLRKKRVPEELKVVDGSLAAAGPLCYEVTLQLLIDQHLETLVFQVTKLGSYPIILGKSWLRHHNPQIDWAKNLVTFCSGYCQAHCLPIRKVEPTKATPPRPVNHKIALVSASGFYTAARQKGSQFFVASVRTVNKLLDDPVDPEVELENLKKLIPSEFHEFLPLFTKKEADKLPPHRYVDHAIELLPDTKPSFGPLYSMSESELKELRGWLEENLSKGFIRSSSSSCASPILFVQKPGGGLRLCVDYRALNKITKKNRYPLPLIEETLNRVQGAKYFTRLDLRSAFNLIRIKEGDEWKTAFRTRYGLFEFLVMPFGLTNAPATCQQYVNDTLREFLDIFCAVYLDDILIYSKSRKEHIEHVKKILRKLQEAGLCVKGEKCEFMVSETTFLGFVIGRDGVRMDPVKVQAVLDWEAPQNVHDVQCFLGFANFYRRFIQGYSRKCRLLFDLLRKDTKFDWTSAHQACFDELKQAFTSAPILRHFDPTVETVIECDSSDHVCAGILSQRHPVGDKFVLHPVAFYSKKMSPAECNYGIGDKELLAIIYSFQEWRHYILGSEIPILVLSDHLNLQSFMEKKLLNRRQARWAVQLSEYNFSIVFRPGVQNKKADSLTRRSGDRPKEGDSRGRPISNLLSPEDFLEFDVYSDKLPQKFSISSASLASFSISDIPISFRDLIVSSLTKDTLGQEIIKALETNQSRHPKVPLSECSYASNLLSVYGLIYVPNDEDLQRRIIQHIHDHPASGHPGTAATYELLSRSYWWPGMRKTVARFIRNCDTCARIKPVRHPPFGFLKSLEIPQRRWEDISCDFIVGLPDSNGYNAIWVIVDRLTKMAHFVPCRDDYDSKKFAELFVQWVFRLHGLPSSVVSDRGSVFTSRFTRELCKILKIKQKLSTAFHPQTDGQTERINAILEQYLRGYCNYQQDDWLDFLSLAEFSHNNKISSTTGLTPFFANYGYHPRYEFLAADDKPKQKALKSFVDQLDQLEKHIQAEITWANAAYSEQADQHRSAPPVLNPGDEVWLLSRHIRTQRPSKKLDFKRLGRFKILERVGTHAYKLELPPTMKVHPVFHVSLLEPVATDPLPGQVQPPPPPVVVDGDLEWEVEEILDSRRRPKKGGKLQYYVKWYGEYQPTWEPAANLQHSAKLIRKFHEQYPKKPRPSHLPDPESDSDSEFSSDSGSDF